MNHDISILFSMKSIVIFILVISRISGMLITAPLFSTFPIPVRVKAGLAAMTAFVIYPMVVNLSNIPAPHDLITLAVMIFKEIIVGSLIGFCAQLIFIGIQIAGQLLSIEMGLTIAETLDPVTHQNVPVIGQFYLFIASLIFINLNGHQWLFMSIFDSYKSIPIGVNFDFTISIAPKILYFTSQLFAIAFGIIMPIFTFLFLIDITLAFTSKMMPQMNVFMVSLPLKILVGILFMSLFMTTTAHDMTNLIRNQLDYLSSIFM
jgi:flagellar biosynthesis protein FliR